MKHEIRRPPRGASEREQLTLRDAEGQTEVVEDFEPPDQPGTPTQPVAEGGLRGPRLVHFGLAFYGAMAAVALIWRVALYGEPILYASDEAAQRGVQFWHDAGTGALAGVLLLAVSHAATRMTAWGEQLARALAEALGEVSLAGALALALVSGVAEEMLFRGALQPRVGLLLAGVIFGLVHFAPRRELLPWTGFAILAGLLFGLLFELTGNLIAPVVAHVLVNGVNIPFLVREYGAPSQR